MLQSTIEERGHLHHDQSDENIMERTLLLIDLWNPKPFRKFNAAELIRLAGGTKAMT